MPLFKTMNIKIDNEGFLLIERLRKGKATMIQLICPFDLSVLSNHGLCGDWCPHFGEPLVSKGGGDSGEDVMELELCHHKILIGTITDERAKV